MGLFGTYHIWKISADGRSMSRVKSGKQGKLRSYLKSRYRKYTSSSGKVHYVDSAGNRYYIHEKRPFFIPER